MTVPSEQSLHGPQVILKEQTAPLHRGMFVSEERGLPAPHFS